MCIQPGDSINCAWDIEYCANNNDANVAINGTNGRIVVFNPNV